MSGHGETPTEDDEAEVDSLTLGQKLYTDDGREVGQIRGFEKGGVFVTVRDGVEAFTIEHARSGHALGEALLMWRCMECGEMGKIREDVPDQCPNCGTERENLMYWTED